MKKNRKYAVQCFLMLTLCSCESGGDWIELSFVQDGSASYAKVNIEIHRFFNGVCFLEVNQSTDEIKSEIAVALIDSSGQEWPLTMSSRRLGRESDVTCYDFVRPAQPPTIKMVRVSHAPAFPLPAAYWNAYDK